MSKAVLAVKAGAMCMCLGGAFTLGQNNPPPVPKPKPVAHVTHHRKPVVHKPALVANPFCPGTFGPVKTGWHDETTTTYDTPLVPPEVHNPETPPGGSHGVGEPLSIFMLASGVASLWIVRKLA